MIKSLQIKYFQSHKKTIINLHSGVTYIVGNNDAGKSATIRALRWVVENSPSGFGFKSHFAGKKDITSSAIEFSTEGISEGISEGTEVIRERNNSINQYRVDSEEYKALAGKVPEELSEILKLDSINIQNQFAPYFLLCETPGKVAEKFNEVFGLEIIDTSSSKIKKIIKEAKSNRTHEDKEVKKLQTAIDSLLWIDGVEEILSALENKEKNIKLIKERINRTNIVFTGIEKVETSIKRTQDFLTIEILYNKLVQNNEKFVELKKKINSINKVLEGIEEAQEKVNDSEILKFEEKTDFLIKLISKIKEKEERTNKIVKVVQEIECTQKRIDGTNIIQYEDIVIKLLEKSVLVKEITIRGKRIADVVRTILKTQTKMKTSSESVKNKEAEHTKILKELEICPFCNQKISQSMV